MSTKYRQVLIRFMEFLSSNPCLVLVTIKDLDNAKIRGLVRTIVLMMPSTYNELYVRLEEQANAILKLLEISEQELTKLESLIQTYIVNKDTENFVYEELDTIKQEIGALNDLVQKIEQQYKELLTKEFEDNIKTNYKKCKQILKAEKVTEDDE